MSEPRCARPWITVLADGLLFVALPAAFLSAYLTYFGTSQAAVLPHLKLISIAFAATACLRLTFARWLHPQWLRHGLNAFLICGIGWTLVIYYALVLTGLSSWGRVISWELFQSYAGQAEGLSSALGVPYRRFIAALLAMFLISWAAAMYVYAPNDWLAPLAKRLRGRVLAITVTGIAVYCAVSFVGFVGYPRVTTTEPIALTFFEQEASDAVQGHVMNRFQAAHFDALDAEARAKYQVRSDAKHQNVILIVVDALRAGHLPAYGYHRNTTPRLSSILTAKNALVVRNVHSICGASACGLQGLSSSRYLHQFSQRPFSLQEVLRRHGYLVHFILGGDHTHFYGLKTAYGTLDSYYDGADAHGFRNRYVNDDTLVIDRLKDFKEFDGRPVMMQFHLMSTHMLGIRRPKHRVFQPEDNYPVGSGFLSPVNRSDAINYYDNGVLETDAIIEELLHILSVKRYLEDALVVITADHGEMLGEHGMYQHANSVYEPLLEIPLIVIPYGSSLAISERVRPKLVSQIDVAPTLLRLLGMNIPDTWSGHPLSDRIHKSEVIHFQEGADAGLLDADVDSGKLWKFWRDTSSGKEFAFELLSDPDEQNNRIGQVELALLGSWRRKLLSAAPVAFEVLDPGSPIMTRLTPSLTKSVKSETYVTGDDLNK